MTRVGVADAASASTNIRSPRLLIQHPASGTWPPRVKTVLRASLQSGGVRSNGASQRRCKKKLRGQLLATCLKEMGRFSSDLFSLFQPSSLNEDVVTTVLDHEDGSKVLGVEKQRARRSLDAARLHGTQLPYMLRPSQD